MDSGFHRPKLLPFQIPDYLTWSDNRIKSNRAEKYKKSNRKQIFSLRPIHLSNYCYPKVYLFLSSLQLHSGYIKVWDGSGRMVFTRVGCQSNYTSSKFLETAFQYSQNITIEASLTNHQSYVRVSYGIIKDGLGAGKEYKQLLKCYTRNFYFSFKRTFISRRNAEL